jgi:hypothetical protein
MKGPMKLLDVSSGLLECKICGSRHHASLQSGSERADGITRLYRGSYQCSWDQCPSNQKEWDESKQRYLKPNWRKLLDSVAAPGRDE